MSITVDERLLSADEEALSKYMDDAPEVVVVDWREQEQAIVEAVADIIAPDLLTYEWSAQGDIILRYKGIERPVGLTFSMKDRYVCLRAIRDILFGDYELRLFQASYYSDTHVFLVKPASWWAEFDSLYREHSSLIFQRIDAALDFP